MKTTLLAACAVALSCMSANASPQGGFDVSWRVYELRDGANHQVVAMGAGAAPAGVLEQPTMRGIEKAVVVRSKRVGDGVRISYAIDLDLIGGMRGTSISKAGPLRDTVAADRLTDGDWSKSFRFQAKGTEYRVLLDVADAAVPR